MPQMSCAVQTTAVAVIKPAAASPTVTSPVPVIQDMMEMDLPVQVSRLEHVYV